MRSPNSALSFTTFAGTNFWRWYWYYGQACGHGIGAV